MDEYLEKLKISLGRAEEYGQGEKKLSEIDTQVILVESVLKIAGYVITDPFVVKRAGRGRNKKDGDTGKWIGEFDVEVYAGDDLKIAIEVKSLLSSEINVSEVINPESSAGKLYLKDGWWWREEKRVRDGIGQLRAYCMNFSHFIEGSTLPVLTDGKEWVLFRACCINPTGGENMI